MQPHTLVAQAQTNPSQVQQGQTQLQAQTVAPQVPVQAQAVLQTQAQTPAPSGLPRRQGLLTKWFDKKGYGFISVEGTDEQLFLHHKVVAGCRPQGGETVCFRGK